MRLNGCRPCPRPCCAARPLLGNSALDCLLSFESGCRTTVVAETRPWPIFLTNGRSTLKLDLADIAMNSARVGGSGRAGRCRARTTASASRESELRAPCRLSRFDADRPQCKQQRPLPWPYPACTLQAGAELALGGNRLAVPRRIAVTDLALPFDSEARRHAFKHSPDQNSPGAGSWQPPRLARPSQ
jgi:hypothetical protein